MRTVASDRICNNCHQLAVALAVAVVLYFIPSSTPGAVRAAVAGGRHFWAAVLWLVARWTRWPTYVVAERWLPQGADNGRFMADIIPPALCSTIPDLIPVPLWGSSSVQK